MNNNCVPGVAACKVRIWNSVMSLSSEEKQFLHWADAQDSRNKYRIHPPSITVGLYLVLFGLLFFTGAFFAAHSMFVEKVLDGYGLKMVVLIFFPIVGLISTAVGLKMDIKRLGKRKYYIFLHDDVFVERSFRHVTFIPRDNIHHAFERTELRIAKTDLYYDSLIYKDTEGKERLYDLKDHYYGKNVKRPQGHDNLFQKIQSFYKVGAPPPQKRLWTKKTV